MPNGYYEISLGGGCLFEEGRLLKLGHLLVKICAKKNHKRVRSGIRHPRISNCETKTRLLFKYALCKCFAQFPPESAKLALPKQTL